MDTQTAAVFDVIREAAAEAGLTMRMVDTGEFAEIGRRAWLRRGMRFHVTSSAAGHPVYSSWSAGEGAARDRFRAAAREWAGRPGACVTLIDEVERATLAVWPEEPS